MGSSDRPYRRRASNSAPPRLNPAIETTFWRRPASTNERSYDVDPVSAGRSLLQPARCGEFQGAFG